MKDLDWDRIIESYSKNRTINLTFLKSLHWLRDIANKPQRDPEEATEWLLANMKPIEGDIR